MRNCVRFPLLSLAGLCTVACTSLSVTFPFEGKTYAAPVRVEVSASADIQNGSLRATLDGTDVSNAFTSSGSYASASLPASPGSHTLEVSANVWNGLWRNYDPRTAKTTHFNAGAPGSIDLQLASPVVAIAPGATEQLPVWIGRYGAFTGQVNIHSSLGNMVIYGNAYTGSLPLTASSAARVGEQNTAVVASGSLYDGTVDDREALKLRYAHRPGLFSPGVVAAKHALDTQVGPDGVTTLIVQNGPPGARRFEARFRKQSTTIVRPIDFDSGTPDFGGGGFCPGGVGGFVISGGSSTAAHEISVLLFEDLDLQVFSIPATAPGGTNVVQPKLHFSPTCGVVVVIGADTDPTTQQAFRAEAFDLLQRKKVCSVASNAPQFQAQLLAPAAGNQILRITFGGQPTDCPIF